MVALSYLLYAIANVATTGVLIFPFKFVLDNQAVYSATGVIALVAGLIMAPLYPIRTSASHAESCTSSA